MKKTSNIILLIMAALLVISFTAYSAETLIHTKKEMIERYSEKE